MNIKEALKIILCDSQKGVDYNKFIKAEDYVLRFNENESYSTSDCDTIPQRRKEEIKRKKEIDL